MGIKPENWWKDRPQILSSFRTITKIGGHLAEEVQEEQETDGSQAQDEQEGSAEETSEEDPGTI